jgi:DUF917 family protein
METIAGEQAIRDFVVGLAVLGTGGGAGGVGDGLRMLGPILASGQGIGMLPVKELADEAWTCAVASWGGRDPDSPPTREELARYGLRTERLAFGERMATAARELAAFGRIRLGAVISMELGPAATVGAVLAARLLGIPVLDGDYVGRAIPEAGQTKMDLLAVGPTPMAFADRWGNVTIVKAATSALMADRIARQLSVAAYGKGVAGSAYLVQGRTARTGMVCGSLSKAVEIGRAVREGAGNGEGLGPLAGITGGRILFAGEAVSTTWHETEAFVFRIFTYELRGTGAFHGERCRVWVKNEHHIVWREEQVIGTSPDLLVLFDAVTSEPLSTRGEVTPGRKVIVFGMPALDPIWHTAKGEALLGPRHFGFDFDCVPV